MGGREGQPSHGKVVRPRKKRIEGEGKGYIIFSESSQPPPSFLRAEGIVYGMCVCVGGEMWVFQFGSHGGDSEKLRYAASSSGERER